MSGGGGVGFLMNTDAANTTVDSSFSLSLLLLEYMIIGMWCEGKGGWGSGCV